MNKFSEKFRVYRFRQHYSGLYPAVMDSPCKQFLKNNLTGLDLSKPILIVNSHDWMRQSFLYLFMQKGFVDYKFLSAYSLLDVYLGNNEDIKSVLDITAEVVCLYLGYGEFENKRQVDVIIQLINNLVLQGKTVWVYCRTNESAVDSRYPGLTKFFKDMSFSCVMSVHRGPIGREEDL